MGGAEPALGLGGRLARVTIDREVAVELARTFWFDEATWLARAGYAA